VVQVDLVVQLVLQAIQVTQVNLEMLVAMVMVGQEELQEMVVQVAVLVVAVTMQIQL
jgi:hypothetical protein